MAVVAIAGHVDHGKSALVHALTGFATDRLADEQRREMTIDLGFSHMKLPSGCSIGVIDVPGHSGLLSNTIAGLSSATMGILVVDSREGWRAQTEEHLQIIRLLQLPLAVLVLSKLDLVDRRELSLVRREAVGRLVDQGVDGVDIIAVSSTTSHGLSGLVNVLDHRLANAPPRWQPARSRLWIDRAFTLKGAGTIVTGTTAGGAFAVGDRLIVEPESVPVKVRRIERHGDRVDVVGPGERAALNITGASGSQLRRGQAIVRPTEWWPTRAADVELTVLDTVHHRVGRRGAYVAHVGSGHFPVRLALIGQNFITPGSQAFARLYFSVTLPLTPGDRYILREPGRNETIGGGEVLELDPMVPVSRAKPDRSWERIVAERGWVTAVDLTLLTGKTFEPNVGQWIVVSGIVERVAAEVRQRIESADLRAVPLASLDPKQRAVALKHDGFVLDGMFVRVAGRVEDLANHPVAVELLAEGFAPRKPVADVLTLRFLAQHGILVERQRIWFHATVVADAETIVRNLLRSHPAGFSVGEFRGLIRSTRRHALALLEELDARGITRRRGSLRGPGSRLLTPGAESITDHR